MGKLKREDTKVDQNINEISTAEVLLIIHILVRVPEILVSWNQLQHFFLSKITAFLKELNY